MLTPLNAFAQLTSADLHARKRRWTLAALLYGAALICVLFALGFGAAALTFWLAITYDWIIALTVTACLFLAVAAIALIANALLQRRAQRRIERNSALRSAALATALVTLRRSGGTLLPAAAIIGGAIMAFQMTASDESDDRET